MSSRGRENWSTRAGFILAAVGSAVGLGNMWRFPYMVAENGGAAFVFLFVLLLLIIGLPVMVAEFILGRGASRSPVPALSQWGQPNWSWLGLLFVATGFVILSYYSVVAGWTVRYLFDATTGRMFQFGPSEYFSTISQGHGAFMFHLLFMVITAGVVIGGVKRGIELCVKTLVPLLVLLMGFLAVWAFFLEPERALGTATEGLTFYLWPDAGELSTRYEVLGTTVPFLDLGMLGSAAGQAFFTLSLGMGAMITYSSYVAKNRDLFEEGTIISLSDLAIALLAGLMVFPFLAIFGLLEEGQGGAALFQSVHAAFEQMDWYLARGLGGLFYLSIFMAALTSAISLLEVVTSTLIDLFNVRRFKAASGSGFLIFLLGIPAAYRMTWLEYADLLAADIMLLFGGLMMAIYVGWVMNEPEQELRKGLTWDLTSVWLTCLRYFVVPVLFILLVRNVWTDGMDLVGALIRIISG